MKAEELFLAGLQALGRAAAVGVLLIGLFFALAAVGAGSIAQAAEPMARNANVARPAAAAPVLSKSAVDPITGLPLVGPVPGGSTIKYVLEYALPGAATPPLSSYSTVSITDTLGPGLTYAPGSLQMPVGWTSNPSVPFSTGSTTTFVGSQLLSGSGTMLTVVGGPPNTTSTGSGDGYTPVIVGNRVYAFNHHAQSLTSTSPPSGMVECWFTSLVACTSAQFNQFAPGLVTFSLTRYAVRINGDVYFAAYDSSNMAGIACYRAGGLVGMPCSTPFTQIAAYNSGVDGPVAGVVADAINPAKLYIAIRNSTTGATILHCRLAPAMSPCVAPWPAGGLVLSTVNPSLSLSDLYIDEANNRIYVQAGGFELHCIDATAASLCAGFATVALGANPSSLSPFLSTTGAMDGICLHNMTLLPGAPQPNCYTTPTSTSTSSGAAIPSSNLTLAALKASLVAVSGKSNVVFQAYRLPVLGIANTHRTQVLYPGRQGAGTPQNVGGVTVCFDFAAAPTGACAGFTGWAPSRPPNISASAESEYGYMASPSSPRCVYGYGDKRKLFRFDALTGDEGCLVQEWQIANPAKNFCDGKSHGIAWGTASFIGVPAYLATGSTLVVTDSVSGIQITSIPIVPGQPNYSLAAVNYNLHPQITVTLNPVYGSGAPTVIPNYSIYVSYTANANPQICFLAKTPCGQPVKNTATLSLQLPPPSSSPNRKASNKAENPKQKSWTAASSLVAEACPTSCCPPLSSSISLQSMFTQSQQQTNLPYNISLNTSSPAFASISTGYNAYLTYLKFICPAVDKLKVIFTLHNSTAIGPLGIFSPPYPGNLASDSVIFNGTTFSFVAGAPSLGTTLLNVNQVYGVGAHAVGVDAQGNPVQCGFASNECASRFTFSRSVGGKPATHGQPVSRVGN